MSSSAKKPVVLIIRDGWGYNPHPEQNEFNAVFLSKHPVDDALMREYPHTLIKTCGLDVGLPVGVMGNSEVGHQNIGAGRIVDQEIVRIDKAIEMGEIYTRDACLKTVEYLKKTSGSLHIMGLMSDGGVHSMTRHLKAFLELARRNEFKKVYIHAFTDGRDTPPTSSLDYLKAVEGYCRELGVGRIATVCGRYFSMDRDKRWDRVQKAYECLVSGKGKPFSSAREAILSYHANPSIPTMHGDEFVSPSNMVDESGKPIGLIQDGDAVIFFNYRGDRPREITRALVQPDFKDFDTGKQPSIFLATMTQYEPGLPYSPIFLKPPKMTDILGMHVSKLGMKQFRCAETEKYPHVTFFFNDYRDEPFAGEDREIIPSPKVPTYDMQPEMSAQGVADETIKRVRSGQYDLVVVNFANPDMVGHTGSLPAAIKAVEKVDACVGRVLDAVREMGGSAVVTADHGNCEQMYDLENKCPHTSHTLNDVELIVVDERFRKSTLRSGGRLADVAPTVLKLMGVEQPKEMSGQSLV